LPNRNSLTSPIQGLLGVHSRCGLHTTAVFSGNKGKFDRVGAFLALLARILPYYVQTDVPTKSTLTYEETVAQLRERGLPPEFYRRSRRGGRPQLCRPSIFCRLLRWCA